MSRKLLPLALLAAGLACASFPLIAQPRAEAPVRAAYAPTPDPARQILDLARLFRASDVPGLVRASLPASKWEEVRQAYELKRKEPISEDERVRFAESLQRFTAKDAVDQLMLEIEPKLEEARPQAPGALLMAFGAMQMAVASPESKLTEDQRLALQAALPGLQQWAGSTDFLSSQLMRDALTLLTDAARRAGINSLEQLQAMPLEAVLQRGAGVLTAAKQATRLYGIDLDAIAATLKVDVLEISSDTARVRTTVTVFDAPLSIEHDLVLVEGRWYGKQAAERFAAELDVDANLEG